MLETGYQSKIIKRIKGIFGVAINGKYTETGTADLICGWPKVIYEEVVLIHLHIEVKTEKDYNRVFKSIYEEDGLYKFKDNISSLKEHEYLQITKLNEVRKLGGKALIAWDFSQVKEYMES